MKYKGQPIEKPKPRIIPVIREPEIVKSPDGTETIIDKNIYFQANVILDFNEFEEMCPAPEAPMVTKDGKSHKNLDDPTYRLATEDLNQKRLNWIFLKSVEETEGLEWEKVKISDPSTWELFDGELRDAGFTQMQIISLMNEVYTIQGVDEKKVEEARKSFLAIRAPVGR